ncbi:hypothetical protein PLICRDRAFT_92729 [Plicaturopsis crispa FD-325 SS-3]|nr:hypothetical protein PLICRDRAFT_92729 [Plicaturopsis crispa FD-325 SS-3]
MAATDLEDLGLAGTQCTVVAATFDTLTCTCVIKHPDGLFESYIFPHIQVPTTSISVVYGVKSVSIGSLLAAINETIVGDPCGHGAASVPKQILSFLRGRTMAAVATTRVLIFDQTMELPLHGYHHLGTIPHTIHAVCTPALIAELGNTVFAIDSTHESVQALASTWQACGISLCNCFVIIFKPHSIDISAAAALSDIQFAPLPPLSDGDADFTAAGMVLPVIEEWIRNTPFHSSTATVESAVLDPDPGLLPLLPSTVTTTEGVLLQSHELLSALDSSTPVDSILDVLGISVEDRRDAVYADTSSSTPLISLVLNHRRMSDILVSLGLKGFRDDCDAKSTRRFSGGFVLASTTIIQHFGWSIHSYRKKSQAYAWAEQVAHKQLSSPNAAPVFGHSDYIFYSKWRAIAFMFHSGGAIDSNKPPRKECADADECWAACLSQADLLGRGASGLKVWVNKFLQ